jgi:hypothetical protein
VKRYDLVTNYRCGSAIEEMEPSDDGDWVRYEDVGQCQDCNQARIFVQAAEVNTERDQKAIKALQARIAELEQTVKQLEKKTKK